MSDFFTFHAEARARWAAQVKAEVKEKTAAHIRQLMKKAEERGDVVVLAELQKNLRQVEDAQ